MMLPRDHRLGCLRRDDLALHQHAGREPEPDPEGVFPSRSCRAYLCVSSLINMCIGLAIVDPRRAAVHVRLPRPPARSDALPPVARAGQAAHHAAVPVRALAGRAAGPDGAAGLSSPWAWATSRHDQPVPARRLPLDGRVRSRCGCSPRRSSIPPQKLVHRPGYGWLLDLNPMALADPAATARSCSSAAGRMRWLLGKLRAVAFLALFLGFALLPVPEAALPDLL
jgi:hypothetical protein